MIGQVLSGVFASCVSGTVTCNDARGVQVGLPLWVILVGAVVILAIVSAIVIAVVRSAKRRV
jgi:hypothetical protein